MIPRRIDIPPESELNEVRPQSKWAVLLIARVHKGDDLAAGGAWSCPCRCCQWVRRDIGAL